MHTPPDHDQIRAWMEQVSAFPHKQAKLEVVHARSQAFTEYLLKARPLMVLWSEVSVQPDECAAQLHRLAALRRHAGQIAVPASLEIAHQHLLAAMDAAQHVTAASATEDDMARQNAQTYVESIKAFHAELRRELQRIMALLAAVTPT